MIPAWNATFAEPLVDQVIALVQRDQQEAINLVEAQLAPFAGFHKSGGPRLNLPWLTVYVDGLTFDLRSPGTRHWTARLHAVADVSELNAEAALHLAYQYARVLDIILTSAPAADWATPLPIVHDTVPGGTTAPPAAGSVKQVFVERHEFSAALFEERVEPLARATVTVLVEVEEI